MRGSQRRHRAVSQKGDLAHRSKTRLSQRVSWTSTHHGRGRQQMKEMVKERRHAGPLHPRGLLAAGQTGRIWHAGRGSFRKESFSIGRSITTRSYQNHTGRQHSQVLFHQKEVDRVRQEVSNAMLHLGIEVINLNHYYTPSLNNSSSSPSSVHESDSLEETPFLLLVSASNVL